MKYYDVTFRGVSGREVSKKTVPSEKTGPAVWEDACVKVTEKEIELFVNENYVILYRDHIASIEIAEVTDPIEQAQKRKDELTSVINTLSNMGL